jgi:hypothetical protein
MGEADSTARGSLTYENRIDGCVQTDSVNGRRDHRGKFANGNGSGSEKWFRLLPWSTQIRIGHFSPYATTGQCGCIMAHGRELRAYRRLLNLMENQATFAIVTNITAPRTPGDRYHIELEADHPDRCDWVELFTPLEENLGEDPYLSPNHFLQNVLKRVVLHVKSKTKPSTVIWEKVQVKWT